MLCADIGAYCRELLPLEYVLPPSAPGGLEDFAYIAEKAPAVAASLSASQGEYPLHHPKVCFDESAISTGALCLPIQRRVGFTITKKARKRPNR